MTIDLPIPTEPAPLIPPPPLMPSMCSPSCDHTRKSPILDPNVTTTRGAASPGSVSRRGGRRGVHVDRIVGDDGRAVRIEARRAGLMRLNAWEWSEMRRLLAWAKEGS